MSSTSSSNVRPNVSSGKDMEIGDGFVRNSDLDLTHEYIDEENDSENEFITVKKKKRVHSDSHDEDEEVHISPKIQKPLFQNSKSSDDCIIIAESRDVNLAKMNPIKASKFILDSVGPVKKVINTPSGLKIICNKKQANILQKMNQFDKFHCIYKAQKDKIVKPKIKGIAFGISTAISEQELKEELNRSLIVIENVSRLKKFDEESNKKNDTETVIIEFNDESVISFPTFMYLGYQRITIKEYIAYPVRCYKCQIFGHVAKNCRSTQKCPNCAGNHSYENCQNPVQKKCANCGEPHSAAFKGCKAFQKAKDIKKISKAENMSYADAAKKYKSNNDSRASENVNSDSQSNVVTSFDNSKSNDPTNKHIDNDFIIEKVMENINKKQEQMNDEIVKKLNEKIIDNSTEKDKIIQDLTVKSKQRCLCEFPPEGIIVFVVQIIHFFKDDSFIQQDLSKQTSLIARCFEKCTKASINKNKLFQLLSVS